MMKYLFLMTLFSVSAFSAEEPQNFLKRCYRKDYSDQHKSMKSLTFAVYENLSGDTYGTIQIDFKNGTGGPTSGLAKLTCVSEKENLHCTGDKKGGKVSFVEEAGTGVLKFEEEVVLTVQKSYFPGKDSASRLPANSVVKLPAGIAHACEKLVD